MARSIEQPHTASTHQTRPRAEFWLCLLATLLRWRQNARSRHQLAQLDPRQLADSGISQAERLGELDKPFWRD